MSKEDACSFLKFVTVAISATWQYGGTSRGLQVLWELMSSMISARVPRENSYMFLTYEPMIVVCEYGLILFTQRDYQTSVNVLVPKEFGLEDDLLEYMCKKLDQDDHALDLTSALRFTSNAMRSRVTPYRRRRFVPCRRAMRVLTIVQGMAACYGVHVPLERTLDGVRELASYVPLAQPPTIPPSARRPTAMARPTARSTA